MRQRWLANRETGLGDPHQQQLRRLAGEPGAGPRSRGGEGLRRWWFRSGVGGQPGRQVVRAREVEQGVGQSFQLVQGQSLDPGGGGFAERAAAAVELAEGDGRFAFLAAFLAALLAAFLPALSQPVLYRPGVADLFSGDACNHHDLLLGELREALHQHRQHNRVQIRAAGEDLLAAGSAPPG